MQRTDTYPFGISLLCTCDQLLPSSSGFTVWVYRITAWVYGVMSTGLWLWGKGGGGDAED